jgi:hypothetical protein
MPARPGEEALGALAEAGALAGRHGPSTKASTIGLSRFPLVDRAGSGGRTRRTAG